MKKLKYIVFFVILIILSVAIKIFNVYAVLTDNFWAQCFKTEHLNYIINALFWCFIFSVLEKASRKNYLKIIYSFLIAFCFVFQLAVENYLLLYIRINKDLQWQYPFSYIEVATYGLKGYLQNGCPQYHWAVIGMLAVCGGVILYQKYKAHLKAVCTNLLMKEIYGWDFEYADGHGSNEEE